MFEQPHNHLCRPRADPSTRVHLSFRSLTLDEGMTSFHHSTSLHYTYIGLIRSIPGTYC